MQKQFFLFIISLIKKICHGPFFHAMWLACIFLLSDPPALTGQTLIPIETSQLAMVLQTAKNGDLNMIYFGKKLNNAEEYAQISGQYHQPEDYTGSLNAAYTPSGSRNLAEPAISVVHADGNPSLDLKFIRSSVQKISSNVSLLSILLKDPVYDFEVTLYYKSYFLEDLIEQWSVISHHEKGKVTLQKFASADLSLKSKAFWLTQYHGDWAKEMQPEESLLTHGIKTLDTKLGTRANLFQPSVFMIAFGQPAAEDAGTLLYGGLEWSGNFRVDLELDPQDNLRILAGMNNYATPYQLIPGEQFTTPAFWFCFSDQGKGNASRKVQRWARDYKILDGSGDRLTLLNNWEATGFHFNENKLADLLKATHKLGVDLFLLDDGWFANKYPRNSDHTGLGDWQENKEKLPHGIASLVTEASANQVRFGIWVEPEMVSPKSELYETHRDWVIRQPEREEYYYRNQLVLDLSNPQVQQFVYGVIDSLFIKNPGLAYLKWDCNAVIYNAYSSYQKNQSGFYINYVKGLYSILEKIRVKYPKVPMMLCSGGGGRVDYAALQYFTEFWPSDNTDPIERLFIQWEYSYFYPAITSSNHVTDWGKQPIKFRTDVAMMGKLGFDVDVDKLSPDDLSFCQQAIKNYNAFKNIVWHGEQYRLASPRENAVASLMFVSDSGHAAVMFSYLVNNRYDQKSRAPILLKGLNPLKKYRLKEINIYPGTKTTLDESAVYSGNFLMTVGFNPEVNASRTSVILEIKEIK